MMPCALGGPAFAESCGQCRYALPDETLPCLYMGFVRVTRQERRTRSEAMKETWKRRYAEAELNRAAVREERQRESEQAEGKRSRNAAQRAFLREIGRAP
jgi:hypothetical protein